MVRSKATAGLYLVLVFLSGILVGVVSHRLYVTTTASANTSPRTMTEFRRRYLTEMRQKVGVNDAQVTSINRILDETKRKFDDLHTKEKPLHDQIQQEQIEGIKAVLTEPQKIAFDNWRTERERARQQVQRQRGN
jgi:CRP-like cAMP-binding protein